MIEKGANDWNYGLWGACMGGNMKIIKLMIEKGAISVIAICTHALLSGDAYEKIEKSKLKKLITSDSIEIKKESKKVEHLTCSKIFAEAMYNVHHNKSIDKLFIK